MTWIAIAEKARCPNPDHPRLRAARFSGATLTTGGQFPYDTDVMTIVLTEADTCREYVTPRLVEAGWAVAPHAIGEQHTFTNGRIIVSGGKVRRAVDAAGWRPSKDEIDRFGRAVLDTVVAPLPGVEESGPEYTDANTESANGQGEILTELPEEPRKFYVDGGQVEVIGHLVYDLDTDCKKLQVVKYTEYSGRTVRNLYPLVNEVQV